MADGGIHELTPLGLTALLSASPSSDGEPTLVLAILSAGVLAAVSLTILAIVDRWVWRWPLLRRFFARPDLRGTWVGELRSSWRPPGADESAKPIEAALVITQTLRRIVVSHLTKESRSHTLIADIINDEGGRSLAGLYVNQPRLPRQDTSRIHHGGLLLHIQAGERPRLHGSYWTDRSTHGELEFALVDRAQVTDFPSAQALAQRRNFGFRAATPTLEGRGTTRDGSRHVASGSFVTGLTALFMSFFNEDELRRFAAGLDDGSDPAKRLPGPPVPLDTLADALARLIVRERWEDRTIARLLDERPRWRSEIESVRSAHGGRLS